MRSTYVYIWSNFYIFYQPIDPFGDPVTAWARCPSLAPLNHHHWPVLKRFTRTRGTYLVALGSVGWEVSMLECGKVHVGLSLNPLQRQWISFWIFHRIALQCWWAPVVLFPSSRSVRLRYIRNEVYNACLSLLQVHALYVRCTLYTEVACLLLVWIQPRPGKVILTSCYRMLVAKEWLLLPLDYCYFLLTAIAC